ncbi:MAG: Gx transporter family protein [Clostridiales bacterium]|nr:Gx transporter family protein [Clostridiales bacterium]
MKKSSVSAKTIATLAMMIALAMIFSYVESLIPINFGIPGVKLGLANLVIVASLYLLDGKRAFLISVVRIILSGFLFGNLASILYSLAGGILSLAIMILLKKSKKLSVLTVSVAGGICHNIGQLVVAILVVENLKLVFYIPVLLVSGFLTGLLIGVVSQIVLPRMKRAFSF